MNDIEKIQEYVPTVYVNDSEPDLNETNLNKTEEALKRVTDAANKAIDALKQLEQEKLSLSAISSVLSDANDKVPSLALVNAMQKEIDETNSNLSNKANASDFNAFKNMIGLTNISGMNFGYDGTFVNIWWLFGANKEFGHALNIKVSDGTLQFYNLINGSWQIAWTK